MLTQSDLGSVQRGVLYNKESNTFPPAPLHIPRYACMCTATASIPRRYLTHCERELQTAMMISSFLCTTSRFLPMFNSCMRCCIGYIEWICRNSTRTSLINQSSVGLCNLICKTDPARSDSLETNIVACNLCELRPVSTSYQTTCRVGSPIMWRVRDALE